MQKKSAHWLVERSAIYFILHPNIAFNKLPKIVETELDENTLKISENISEITKTFLITKCNWQKINNIELSI